MVPKLRFKNFEGIWEPKSLKDIACLTSSKRVHLSDYVKEGIPFFRGKEITELKSGIIPSDILYISPLLFNEFKVKHGTPRAGEILITAVGTLGNIYHINNIGDFYFKDGNLIWLRELKCNSLFLSFLLTFKKNEILNSAIGSTQKALTMVELNKLVFNYPRNDEQVKIASFLSLLEEKTSLLNKQYDLLCQYKKGIMQKIFSQELRFKDENGDVYSTWKIKPLKELYTLLNTNSLSRSELNYESGNIKNIHYGDIHTKFNGRFDITKELVPYISKTIKIAEECYCRKGDLVIADASEDYNDIGKCIEITNVDQQQLVAGLHTFLARPNTTMALGFGSYMMQSSEVRRQIKVFATGVSVLSITKKNLLELMIPLPSIEEQTKIANFLSALDDKIAVKKAELDKLKTWKQGLLQQMFV
ncbi:restriction endonuclease subunit S [Klebsiella michiganensis]